MNNLEEAQKEMRERGNLPRSLPRKKKKTRKIEKDVSQYKYCEEAKSDPFYGRGRHAVDPYVFPDDDSVGVVHEGVLSHMITLHVVPFSEMEYFVVPAGIPANQELAAMKMNMKAAAGTVERNYSAEQALERKEKAELCELCKKPFKNKRDKKTDHSHTTGSWRGVLCGNCNSGLGMFQDSPEICRAAAVYLLNKK